MMPWYLREWGHLHARLRHRGCTSIHSCSCSRASPSRSDPGFFSVGRSWAFPLWVVFLLVAFRIKNHFITMLPVNHSMMTPCVSAGDVQRWIDLGSVVQRDSHPLSHPSLLIVHLLISYLDGASSNIVVEAPVHPGYHCPFIARSSRCSCTLLWTVTHCGKEATWTGELVVTCSRSVTSSQSRERSHSTNHLAWLELGGLSARPPRMVFCCSWYFLTSPQGYQCPRPLLGCILLLTAHTNNDFSTTLLVIEVMMTSGFVAAYARHTLSRVLAIATSSRSCQ